MSHPRLHPRVHHRSEVGRPLRLAGDRKGEWLSRNPECFGSAKFPVARPGWGAAAERRGFQALAELSLLARHLASAERLAQRLAWARARLAILSPDVPAGALEC